jgi:hypothetical protein
MTRTWFIVWAIAISLVGAWAFAPAETPAPMSAGDGRAFNDTEKYTVEARLSQRKSAMAALDLAWSSRCGEDRKRFIGGINEYYYQRQNQTERYPEIHGKLGADYIAAQWSTADDQRIDRLTQEAYARGYLKPSDFDGVASKMVATVVKNERVTAKGCAS